MRSPTRIVGQPQGVRARRCLAPTGKGWRGVGGKFVNRLPEGEGRWCASGYTLDFPRSVWKNYLAWEREDEERISAGTKR